MKVQPLVRDLNVNAVYRAPSGRLCRLVQLKPDRPDEVVLMYDMPFGGPANTAGGDGFTLSARNLYLLRRVG